MEVCRRRDNPEPSHRAEIGQWRSDWEDIDDVATKLRVHKMIACSDGEVSVIPQRGNMSE